MKRQALTDGSGRWFDPSRAEAFGETETHDGRNLISDATGSQWEHEVLYRTAGGRWVLRHWSQWQGSADTFEEVDDLEAAKWLVRCGHEPHEACADKYAALEIK